MRYRRQFQIWAGLPPYHAASSDQQVFLAIRRKEVPQPARPADVSVIAWSLVENCSNFDPTTRPCPDQLVKNLHALRLIMPRLYPHVSVLLTNSEELSEDSSGHARESWGYGPPSGGCY